MKTPDITGRIFKPIDWFGWVMSFLGIVLMCEFGGVGWIFGHDKDWWLFALTFLLFWEYAARVAFGRVYKFVYFDTIMRKMYQIEINDKQFYICASTQDELDLYMETIYPSLEYEILSKSNVESFIKTEQHC